MPKCKYCNRKAGLMYIKDDEKIHVCAKHSSIYLRTNGRMDMDLLDRPDYPEPDEPWEDNMESEGEGKWIIGKTGGYLCSICGHGRMSNKYSTCPVCGNNMKVD